MNVEKHQHITDSELMAKFYMDHDNYWLGVLFPRYTLLLFGVCMKYLKNEEEAKDSVQQIFLKAITELHKYKVDYFKSWVYMVAKNHCLMILRDRHGKFTEDFTDNMAGVITQDEYDQKLQHLEKDRKLELIGNAIEELSKEQKVCITLFYLEKRSYQAIAETTGYSVLKVKSSIQNGKRNLRILLDSKPSRIKNAQPSKDKQ